MLKESGVAVFANENNELVSIRIQTGWRVCIDYRKLNSMTRKDHFHLPFIEQMLERLRLLSLSLTCVYILHAYISFIFTCLIYLCLHCYMLGDCLLTLVFNQESHIGTSTLI